MYIRGCNLNFRSGRVGVHIFHHSLHSDFAQKKKPRNFLPRLSPYEAISPLSHRIQWFTIIRFSITVSAEARISLLNYEPIFLVLDLGVRFSFLFLKNMRSSAPLFCWHWVCINKEFELTWFSSNTAWAGARKSQRNKP